MKKALRMAFLLVVLVGCAPSTHTDRAIRDLVVFSPGYAYGVPFQAHNWKEWSVLDDEQSLVVTRFWGDAGLQLLFDRETKTLFDKIMIDRYDSELDAEELFAGKYAFHEAQFGQPAIYRSSGPFRAAAWNIPGATIVLAIDRGKKEVLYEVRLR